MHSSKWSRKNLLDLSPCTFVQPSPFQFFPQAWKTVWLLSRIGLPLMSKLFKAAASFFLTPGSSRSLKKSWVISVKGGPKQAFLIFFKAGSVLLFTAISSLFWQISKQIFPLALGMMYFKSIWQGRNFSCLCLGQGRLPTHTLSRSQCWAVKNRCEIGKRTSVEISIFCRSENLLSFQNLWAFLRHCFSLSGGSRIKAAISHNP